MNDIENLYQELILDHYRRPRNHRRLEHADRTAAGANPICGDHLTVYLKLDGDIVREVTFEGGGCAISTASASLMTETLRGKTLAEAQRIFRRFHELLTGGAGEVREAIRNGTAGVRSVGNAPPGTPPSGADEPRLGKLEAFSGVCRYPARVKCATLAWHTLDAALAGKAEQVISTE